MLVRLQGVGEPSKLGHDLWRGIDALNVTRTPWPSSMCPFLVAVEAAGQDGPVQVLPECQTSNRSAKFGPVYRSDPGAATRLQLADTSAQDHEADHDQHHNGDVGAVVAEPVAGQNEARLHPSRRDERRNDRNDDRGGRETNVDGQDDDRLRRPERGTRQPTTRQRLQAATPSVEGSERGRTLGRPQVPSARRGRATRLLAPLMLASPVARSSPRRRAEQSRRRSDR